MTAIIVVAAACGGSDEDLVEPTVTAPVTVEPSSTPTPSPTAAATPIEVPLIEKPIVDLATLVIPVCRTDPFAGEALGLGTIPRVPENGTTSRSELDDQQSEIIVAVAPVIRWVNHFTSEANFAWDLASSDQEIAAVLAEESRRLWLACNAVAAISPTDVTTHPLLISLKSLLAERQVWLTERLEVLRTAPDAIRDGDSVRLVASEALTGLIVRLEDFAIEAGIEDRVASVPFTVPNPLLEVSLDVPAGWMLIRNRTDIVLAAPPGVQAEGVVGLGVPGWNFGTALRVRRLRHEAPWSLGDTTNLMDSLLSKFGKRTSDEKMQIDGLQGTFRSYDAQPNDWVTIAATTVRDLHTYLFELGCPAADRDACEGILRDFLGGVRFGQDLLNR